MASASTSPLSDPVPRLPASGGPERAWGAGFLNQRWRRELLAIAVLLGVVLAFLMPGLLQWEYLCFDDVQLVALPQLMGVARGVQGGEVPWWDHRGFCGARPFYALVESPMYNVLMYPLFMLADLDDVGQCYYVLYLIPFAAFVLSSALGAYLFGRWVLRINRTAAVVSGVLYALGPHMGVSIIMLLDASALSFIPWMMLAAARFMETARARWWIAGAVFPALMACSCTVNYTVRVYFLLVVVIALLWFFSTRHRPGAWLRLAAVVAMVAVSVTLAGVMWAGVLDGVGWLRNATDMSYSVVAGEDEIHADASMPFSNLLTMLIPDFFGTRVLGRRVWGSGIGSHHMFLLSGGLLVSFCLLTVLRFTLWRRPLNEPMHNTQAWSWIGLLVLIGTLLTMLGRHTPVFAALCKILPWFFLIPYPYYYQFAQCWSVAVLAGIGLSTLMTHPACRERLCRPPVVVGYLVVSLLLAGATMFERVQVGDTTVAAYQTLGRSAALRAFISGPAVYILFAVIGSIAAVLMMNKRNLTRALAAGVVVECFLFGYPVLYRNTTVAFEHDVTAAEVLFQTRYPSPTAHPRYYWIQQFDELADDEVRWIGSISGLDNLAWVLGGRSALGDDSKPLMPRMQQAFSFMSGWPYGLSSLYYPRYLLSNMNVGYLLSEQGVIGPEGLLDGKRDELDVYWTRDPRGPTAIGSYESRVTGPGLSLYRLDPPLPHVYTQDRVVAAPSATQRERLISTDLRRAVYVEPRLGEQLAAITEEQLASLEAQGNPAERWREMQKSNRVISVDRQRANRLSIEAEVASPTMLVIAEMHHPGWRATVDGVETQVLRVNYLQRGIWLIPGHHRVVLSFFPPPVVYGLAASGGSSLVLIAVGVFGLLRARRRIGGRT